MYYNFDFSILAYENTLTENIAVTSKFENVLELGTLSE